MDDKDEKRETYTNHCWTEEDKAKTVMGDIRFDENLDEGMGSWIDVLAGELEGVACNVRGRKKLLEAEVGCCVQALIPHEPL